MDWGSARPFSVGWWAIVGDDHKVPGGARTVTSSKTDAKVLPRGALVRYREWYGASGINQGLKLDATQVAEGIVSRERDDTLRYGVLDPACFREDGGPSIAERINAVLVAAKKRPFHAADNARVPQRGSMGGWDQLRARLVGQDGVPMIYTFSTCDASIRTIPALAHDQSKPEDVDTEGEDHAGDEWRYACMSRPFAAVPETTKKPIDTGYITHRSPVAEDWVSF
jgi:hypothetical protein